MLSIESQSPIWRFLRKGKTGYLCCLPSDCFGLSGVDCKPWTVTFATGSKGHMLANTDDH